MEVNPNRQLLPFFFTETLTGYILLVNQGGEYLFIKKEEFDLILSNKIRIGSLLVVSIILCKRLFILNYQTYFVTG